MHLTKTLTKLFSGLMLLASVFALSGEARADHNAGGELTWECLQNGKFKFTLRLYRYCEGIQLPSSAFVSSTSPVTSITLTRAIQQDISPKCYDSTQWMTCSGTNTAFTIEENIYISGDVQISGTPPATGWDFYWSSCCRPAPGLYGWGALVDNLEPQNQSYRIKATMFPFNGQNTYPCYDSSPEFAERPATILCTGYPFTFNHNAVDRDLDSLYYTWGSPLQSSGSPVTYATHLNTSQTTPRGSGGGFIVPSPGFSASLPLPWSHSNMSVNNVPAALDPYTGEVKFTSFTKGQYAIVVIVSAYRCGIKISEVMRDIPVTLLTCPPTPTVPPLSNTPPQVVFKWTPNATTNLPLPAGDTVWAGDSTEFYIVSSDIQFLPGFVGQTNYLIPSGAQFGAGFGSTSSGCLYPPCAVMDTGSTYFNSTEGWWEGQYGVVARFKWKTNCNHLNYVDSCFTRSNKYNFVFKVLDNWCPAPGANFQTFSVTVLAPPAIPAPRLKCSKVLPNGHVQLRWDQPVSSANDSLESFRKYIIYRADTANGTYDTLHVVLDIDSLEYTDTTANALNVVRYYTIQGISSCNDQAVRNWSDTIAALNLNTQVFNSGSSVAFSWNPFNPANNFGEKTTGLYYIWMILNGDTTMLDSTSLTYDSLDLFLCYPSNADFFLTVEDTSQTWGCTSSSNLSNELLGDVAAPPAMGLDSLSYDTSNTLHMGWIASSADIDQYYIYRNGVLMDSLPASQSSYSYLPSSSDSCNINFAVAARDSCGNLNSVGTFQTSMCARIVDVIRCDTNKRLILSWDLYNPVWANSPGTQEVWRSVNNGPFTLFDTVAPFTNTYADTSIQANTTYAYRIRSKESASPRGSWTSTVKYTVDRIITGTVIGPPELRCVSWINDTTIRIFWGKPLNPDTNFNRYIIYHSNSSAPASFTAIDSISGIFSSDNLAWDSTYYTYENADPSLAHHFYVESSSGCDGLQRSVKSNTLRDIDLEVTGIRDSINQLDWNPVSSGSTNQNYEIYRDGSFFMNVPNGTETERDKYIVCYDSVLYRIDYPAPNNYCVSSSRSVYGYFEDDTPPGKQFVDSVSMLQDTTFTPVMGWNANASKDISGYLALSCGGGYQVLDTLSPLARFYQGLPGWPYPYEGMTVTALDSCGNSNLAKGDFNCHIPITLKPRLNKCEQRLELDWTDYIQFASGSDNVEYRIYMSVDGNAFTEVGRQQTKSLKVTDLNEGSEYCFFVQAWEKDGGGPFSSSSAVQCLDYKGIIKPGFAYLRYVSVEDPGKARMCMRIDLNSDLGEYWIRRSADPNADFHVISTITLPDPLTPADSNFCFEDENLETDNKSYYYYIDVADPCGNVTASSNLGRTMLLTASADGNNQFNTLKWNRYMEWEGDVKTYHILRADKGDNFTLIESLNAATMAQREDVTIKGDQIAFSDNVSEEINSGDGEYCYYILAEEGPLNLIGLEPATSKSNIACVSQSPQFYSPNSFSPNGDGLNDTFLPGIAFQDLDAFKMTIYNRWGERIYETEDPENGGWDGTYNGKEVPAGAYVYIVVYASAEGNEYEEQGTVTVIR